LLMLLDVGRTTNLLESSYRGHLQQPMRRILYISFSFGL